MLSSVRDLRTVGTSFVEYEVCSAVGRVSDMLVGRGV